MLLLDHLLKIRLQETDLSQIDHAEDHVFFMFGMSVFSTMRATFFAGVSSNVQKLKRGMCMKRSVVFLAVTGLLASLTSCFQNCRAMDDGPIITSDRRVSSFDKIELSVPYDIFYTQGTKCSVKIEGPEKLVKRIATESDGQQLKVYFPIRETFRFGRNCGQVSIFITSPDVTSVVLRGSGTFVAKGKIDSDTLDLHLLGSGDMHVSDVICDQLTTFLQGSGDLTVDNVQAVLSRVRLLGSGDLCVKQQHVTTTDISLTGSGDIDMHMKNCKNVSCKLIGSGDVTLTGDVATLNRSTTGSGDINVSKLTVKK